uniref:NLR family pyrin domain containing 1 n=1 Tax=Ursus americanus TaxID=9643 RepID=A0A452S045_URSAM
RWGGIQWRLAWYLDVMGKEELKEFQLRLSEKPLCGPSPGPTVAQLQKAGGLEVASHLVAQYGEQRAWDLALHTWEQMGLSGLCAQARAEACPWFPCSPSAPSEQSPSGPTSTEVLKFVQDPETGSRRQPPGTSGHMWNPKADPSSPFYQALPSSPDQESPLQESPSAPTPTLVLENWKSLMHPSPEPRKQEASSAWWSLAETSANQSTGEAPAELLERGGWGRGRVSSTSETPLRSAHAGWRPSIGPCPTESWENEDLHQEFIQLLLLHQPRPRRHESLIEWSYRHGVVEKQGHLIEVKDLFGPGLGAQEEPRTVILHGGAGIGKSTMARQVRRAWKEGRLYRDRFQHVVYVSCRELARSETMSLTELITKDWAPPMAPIERILSQPGQLLFILDDLDEPKWVLGKQRPEGCVQWNQQQPVDTLLARLLGKSLLPEASLLITARTLALQELIPSVRQPRWVEVLGFSESGRKEYFYKYFKSESQAVRAFSLVELNQALLTMCLVPLVCWLVCTWLRKRMERGERLSQVPQTATTLCLHYVSEALPAQPLGSQLRGLCALAAEGTWRGKSVLSWEDFWKHELEEATVSALLKTGILRKHPSSLSCCFVHRYLQEFFAAVSCVLGGEDERSHPPDGVGGPDDLLKAYGRLDVFGAPATHFVFGLLSEQGQREMEAVFRVKVPVERKRTLLQWATSEVWNLFHTLPQCSLSMFRCLYEMQDEAFLTRVLVSIDGASTCVHTGLELLVFMFCIRFCVVKKLYLNESGPDSQPLRCVPMTDACWRVLFFTLRTTGNLKDLDLSGNHLSQSAVQSLCEALRFPSCHLETLRLARCGLTAESCRDFASALSTSQTLTHLELSFNSLLDAGAEHLCEGLRQPGCRLHRLLLVGCGLTSGCCQALASTLSTSPSLTELDLQQNELEDVGVRLLCEGLRSPTRQLMLLWLDQTQLSEEVTQMLRALEKEKPPLLIHTLVEFFLPLPVPPEDLASPVSPEDLASPVPTKDLASSVPPEDPASPVPLEDLASSVPTEDPASPVPLGDLTSPVPTEDPASPVPLEDLASPVPPEDLHREPLGTKDDFWGPLGPVATELVDEDRSLYRVRLPVAGSYHWPNTGLRFVVRGPVTIDVEFCAWDAGLRGMVPQQDWVVAGPLFDIKAEPGAVAAVYLPHFVDLRGGHVDTSLFQVAHLKEEGMLVEKPTRVELYHVVLEDPSFSPIGVLLRTINAALRFFPVISVVLLYHRLQLDEIAFHLYLVPSDCCIQKELELCYRSPGEPQLFSEFYVGHLGSGIRLQVRDKKYGTVVWEALVKPGDLRPAPSLVPPVPAASPSPPGAPALLHFMDLHREQLVARVTSVEPVLDKLHGQVLSEEQYERVRAKRTTPGQMRELFSFSRSWDRACKDQVYQALRETHPYLIMELWETGSGGAERGTSPPAP